MSAEVRVIIGCLPVSSEAMKRIQLTYQDFREPRAPRAIDVRIQCQAGCGEPIWASPKALRARGRGVSLYCWGCARAAVTPAEADAALPWVES